MLLRLMHGVWCDSTDEADAVCVAMAAGMERLNPALTARPKRGQWRA